MPRKAREKSESGIYHIMIRGVNREAIFEDDDPHNFIEELNLRKERLIVVLTVTSRKLLT
jgi:putative transposase